MMKAFAKFSSTHLFIGTVIAVYILCLLVPTFFVLPTMLVFNPISGDYPVGQDLRGTLEFAQALRDNFQPYIGTNTYPPLASLVFVPLTYISSSLAYLFITVTTLSIFLVMMVLLQRIVPTAKYNSTITALLAILALSSYGFFFELERGQFNLIVVGLSCLALYLFHRTRYSWLAYLLIMVMINIKLYPAVLLVFFVRHSIFDRRDLMRMIGLVGGSIAMFWVLGHGVFLGFIGAFQRLMDHPLIAIHNHSLSSFLGLFPSLPSYTALVGMGILGLAFLVTTIPILLGWKQADYWLRYPFALAGILMCIIPSVSYDYKLSILPIFFLPYLAMEQTRSRLQTGLWLAATAFVFMTFFSYKNFEVLLPTVSFIGSKFLILSALFVVVWLDAMRYIYQQRSSHGN